MATQSVTWNEELGAWRVEGWEAAVRVMRDPGTFTVDDPRFSTARVVGPSMLSLDGEAHRRHRAPFAARFRPRDVESRFGEFVSAESERLLDAIVVAPGAELRTALANPLATAVVAEAIGLDGSDPAAVAALAGWYAAIVDSVSGASLGRPPTEDGRRAFAALRDALLGHVHDHARASVLTDAAASGTLSPDEVVSNAAVMLFGGIETTEGMILNLVWHLLTNDAQLDRVLADLSLIGDAVEESLRLEPAAAVVDRYATVDVSLAGTEIAAGDMVVVSLAHANRDPDVFSDPDRFDIRRPNTRRQLGFAQGPHVCLGMDLARLEARTAVSGLLERCPGVHLDPSAQNAGPQGVVFRRPESLAVVF